MKRETSKLQILYNLLRIKHLTKWYYELHMMLHKQRNVARSNVGFPQFHLGWNRTPLRSNSNNKTFEFQMFAKTLTILKEKVKTRVNFIHIHKLLCRLRP